MDQVTKGKSTLAKSIVKWKLTKLSHAVDILDNLRKPINSLERKRRIASKSTKELFPYYGATGQVGWIDNFLTDGEYVLVGEDGAPFLDFFKQKAYKIKGKTWVNNHVHILRGKEGVSLNDYVLHYLNSINYREYVNGTTRLKLTKRSLIDIPFPLPSLSEQQAIVSKIEELFSELDKGKQQLETALQQLKVYRQAVLKWAFEGKLTNENVKEGELPEGWNRSRLEDIGDKEFPFSYGVLKPGTNTPNGVPFIQSQHVKHLKISDQIDFKISPELDREFKRTKIKGGEILITLVGASIGRCAVTERKHIGYNVSRAVAVLTFLKSHSIQYLLYFLTNHLNQKTINELSTGSAQPVLNLGTIRNIVVSYPEIEEQKLIVQEIESRLSVCDKLEETINQNLAQAETLRQSILKKAFEGRLI